MFKELKETTPKALKESIKRMFPQIEDISIETEIIKIKQIENPELKNTIPEMKNWLEGLTSISEQAEESRNKSQLKLYRLKDRRKNGERISEEIIIQ